MCYMQLKRNIISPCNTMTSAFETTKNTDILFILWDEWTDISCKKNSVVFYHVHLKYILLGSGKYPGRAPENEQNVQKSTDETRGRKSHLLQMSHLLTPSSVKIHQSERAVSPKYGSASSLARPSLLTRPIRRRRRLVAARDTRTGAIQEHSWGVSRTVLSRLISSCEGLKESNLSGR